MKDLIPFVGNTKARERLDHIFSRQMLGSVLVGSAAGKVVEKALNIFLDGAVPLLAGWFAAFLVFVTLFAYWEQVSRTVEDATG